MAAFVFSNFSLVFL